LKQLPARALAVWLAACGSGVARARSVNSKLVLKFEKYLRSIFYTCSTENPRTPGALRCLTLGTDNQCVIAPPAPFRRPWRSRSQAAAPRGTRPRAASCHSSRRRPNHQASRAPPAGTARAVPHRSRRRHCCARAAACGRGRASLKNSSPKISSNRRTLYRRSQKTPVSSPKLASPTRLGLSLLYPGALAAARAASGPRRPARPHGPRAARRTSSPRRG
jgi:hypothetical protein